jgi:hypothetical protein
MRPKSYTWDNAMVEGRRRLAQTGTDIPMTIAVIATKT